MMDNRPDYKIGFGPDAWTVDYGDPSGKFTFVFDCDVHEFKAKGATKRIFLEGGLPLKNMKVIENPTQADRERGAVMLERVKQYLESLGYEVKVV